MSMSPGFNDDSRWRQMSYTIDFLFKALVFPWAISSCFLIMKPLTTLLWIHSHLSLADEATQPLTMYMYGATDIHQVFTYRSTSLWWSHSIEYRHRHDVSGSLMPDFDEATIFGMESLWNRQHLYICDRRQSHFTFMKPLVTSWSHLEFKCHQ